ncbi:uroporphyrin-III C-methyltransferase [Gracilibacillus halophilus YIM-C55.5]|uniref:Uroporphyrinogen-III C-methyltransferase n=1 Tax=Gracilibacillus halophilus YIM-C55.5 TaxID=1308866 RepID=N4WD36_9BACI|nr:uroporphyrinogen-III C-methyltransferase [Gracilibacillus halophilus]ENH97159.1 uroporphyrin-III C-methyltransferase [Gracilibacillus halophilus YIM-C55.5]
MGKIYLVGAGPGDPELITVKGLSCIKQADVILYDRLVAPQLLQEAKREANLIYCGKLPKLHVMKQETINDILITYAEQGKTVVRLKGGDPFVFGRGAEEVQAIVTRGIDYEVVPGITSGIAAPASMNIPITHRDLGRSFALVTGHSKHGEPQDVKWNQLVDTVDTIAIYMGVRHLPAIVKAIVHAGKLADTPVAVIQEGTTSHQKAVTGTLSTIVEIVEKEHIQNPAMIIIGEVVRIGEEINHLTELQQRMYRSPVAEAF